MLLEEVATRLGTSQAISVGTIRWTLSFRVSRYVKVWFFCNIGTCLVLSMESFVKQAGELNFPCAAQTRMGSY